MAVQTFALDALPDQILCFHILIHLDLRSLLACESTCRKLHALINTTEFLHLLTQRDLASVRYSDLSQPNSLDQFITSELRSLIQDASFHFPSGLDRILPIWFHVTIWGTEHIHPFIVHPVIAKPRDYPPIDLRTSPNIPGSSRSFWCKLFSAFPILSDILIQYAVDYGVMHDRNLRYYYLLENLDYSEFLKDAPFDVKEKLSTSPMRVEMLIIWRITTYERFALAICFFSDSWSCTVVKVTRHGGHAYRIITPSLIWAGSLLTSNASVPEIRTALFYVVNEFRNINESAPPADPDGFQMPFSFAGRDNVRRLAVAMHGFGAGKFFSPCMYDVVRRERLKELDSVIARKAALYAKRFESAQSQKDILDLKLFCDQLVSADRTRFEESKTLGVSIERAIRRFLNKLLLARIMPENTSAFLLFLAMLNELKPDGWTMFASTKSRVAMRIRDLNFGVKDFDMVKEWLNKTLSVHNGVREAWSLGVVHLAERLVHFAARMISFELMVFQSTGRREVEYDGKHVQYVLREAGRVGLRYEAGEKWTRLCDRFVLGL